MKSITVNNISLQFDADQITHGNKKQQAAEAVELVNGILQREPFGLGAQLIVTECADVDLYDDNE